MTGGHAYHDHHSDPDKQDAAEYSGGLGWVDSQLSLQCTNS